MDIVEILVTILVCFWVFVPALVPNSAAVVFGGGTPVDFGKSWKGIRILGDGKTWRGLFGGAFTGVVIGLIQVGISTLCNSPDNWGFGSLWGCVGIMFCLSFGSLFGDMLGSFIKRRMKIERGQKAPVLDQYDFVIGAFLITTIFYPNWVYSMFIEGYHIIGLIVLLVAIWGLHRGVNVIGYKLGLKNEPW